MTTWAGRVEPGGARTDFRFVSARLGAKMDVYEGTPAGIVHKRLQDTSRLPFGDPAKMAKIIIDSVDASPAPKRIALDSDTYTVMHMQLSKRLSILEAQKDSAFSTDWPKNA